MFGYYTPVLLLQVFCLYHAYKNHSQFFWYWVIIFFPGIGCLVYLVVNFYSRRNIQNLANGVKQVVNSNYRIEQLEKELQFSDTITNKMKLADAYMTIDRHKDAADLYTDCLVGFMADDSSLRMKALQAYFLNKDYEAAISLGEKLESEKTFSNARERVAYAWALHYHSKSERAETIFAEMNKPFTNYFHRKEYCKFLLEIGKQEEAKTHLTALVSEFDHMASVEKQLNRDVVREIRGLYSTFQ